MTTWHLTFKGGPFNGKTADYKEAGPVAVAWTHPSDVCPGCEGHFTMDPADDAIVLDRAVSYKRVEIDEKARFAIYELGDVDPSAGEERFAFAGISAGGGSSTITRPKTYA